MQMTSPSHPHTQGFATLTTSQSGQLDQRFRSWSPWSTITWEMLASTWRITRFWSLRRSQQSRSSPRTNTSSRCIQILFLKTHSYHWSAVLKYWEWLWIHPYPSTSTATMCQIGSTREIICWRHWRDHHGDRIRRLYWWHTTHWGNLSQTMQHQSGAPTQVTRALRRYRQRRMRLWGRRPGPTRWPVLTISTKSPSRWESRTTQICFLRSTL